MKLTVKCFFLFGFRTIKPSDLRTIGPSDYWTFVLSDRHQCKSDEVKPSNVRGPGRFNELGSWITYNSYKPITNTAWVRTRLCKLQKGYTRLATQVIKFTSCLPMVSGSLRILRLLPPLNWSP